METAALCKPIQRFADLLRIPDTWVLTGLGKLLAALGSFPHFPQPLRLLHTHLYWRFLECQSIKVTLTQNGHLTHHEIPSVASLRPGGHFPRIGWPVSPEYAPAALLSSMVQGALDGECRAGGSLGQILNNVNRLVLGRSRPQDFVTLFLFSIDAEGKGEYISAGHNPAYLFHASNGNIEELSSNTGILGMFDSLSFESLPLKLDTGDRLIVYSDGVTEATNPADEMFGSERLRKIISGDPSGGPRDLEQKVLESLEEFTEGMPQMDDVTLVVVQNGA